MPVDAPRRPSRRAVDEGEGTHQREIELKRSRGEISCAECRRLKIKCDKKLPCSSCSRRGCASLCPNGSLATGQGTRFVLAATDHLHRRIAKMSERIRQLEDGLSIVQSRVSTEQHPLLRDELLSLKVDKTEDMPLEGEEEPGDVIDAFGTLSITDRGTSRFFGASGGTEMLLLNDEECGSSSNTPSHASPGTSNVASPESQHRDRESNSPKLPPEVLRFSNSFPFTPMGTSREIQSIIESHLPTYDRAWHLSEIHLENAAWIFRAVSPQQLKDEMLPIIYKRQAPLDAAHEYNGPHDLALLFTVFAMGALLDLEQEPYNAESVHYYNLAKAAISLQSIFDKPELVTIQALHLMSVYNAMSQLDEGDEEGEGATSMEMSWSLIRLCHQIAQTIGLDRDSARWGLIPREVQRRRALFWDLFLADSWQSLSTGRPPSITLPYIDCQFPLDDEAIINEEGAEVSSFGSWGFRFACECVAQVAAKTLTASVPSYSTVLELDAAVRDFPMPELPANMPPIDPNKPSMIMARLTLAHTKEAILLYIHRSFFAQAMIDDPVNPLRSQYAPSFLATYRSSAHILKCIREEFELLPELSSRFWSGWTFAFSAAVVFGSVVTRGPGSSMAASSLQELDQATELFSKAAVLSKRAAKALIILQKLQTKSHIAYDNYMKNKNSPSPAPSQDISSLLSLNSQKDGDDELAIFGGRTRLFSPRRGGSSAASSSPMEGTRQTPPYSNSTPPMDVLTSPDASSSDASQTFDSLLSSDGYSASSSRSSQDLSPATGYAYGTNSTAGSSNARVALPPVENGYYYSMDGTAQGPASGLPTAKYEWNTPGYPRDAYSDKLAPGPSLRIPQQSSSSHQYFSPDSLSPPIQGDVRRHPDYRTLPFNIPSMHVPGDNSNNNSNAQQNSGAAPYLYQQPPTPNGGNPMYPYPSFPSQGGGGGHRDHRTDINIGPSGPVHPNGVVAPAPVNGQPNYALSPREFAEMGLPSQSSSGLNQRWTNFMHDTGLFYNGSAHP
ncbi:hypothetical protein SCHPADRAFT_921876 [Schizopora paradoxa]|uniref:Zn(2)-C6 fungal-type domain-containing protein n=1 Tax=Schizopora paradoxa TaxID=27342 RepID=A0A0H2RGT2_9AGAM|nr:hypothetical protein SCHPADRAFT_921876 [Schizopora paradoxa]